MLLGFQQTIASWDVFEHSRVLESPSSYVAVEICCNSGNSSPRPFGRMHCPVQEVEKFPVPYKVFQLQLLYAVLRNGLQLCGSVSSI